MGNRRTGRTTRLADDMIQELFKEGEVCVKDHCDNNRYHDWLTERILNRLKFEHNIATNTKYVRVDFDRKTRIMRLVK